MNWPHTSMMSKFVIDLLYDINIGGAELKEQ